MIGFQNMDKFDFSLFIEENDIVFSPPRSENDLNIKVNFI